MLNLIKPQRLKKGDKVAAVSLSWGGAGDEETLWRYRQGKQRLQSIFGLEVVEMPHTLRGTEYVYSHSEKRAEDLMAAFADPSVRGIISCIGGNDSIRMLPYIDFDLIRSNPKIYTGYSDSTVTHFICLKAGLSSFYGLSVLTDCAENVHMPDYTVRWAQKALFSGEVIGDIPVSEEWTGQRLAWLVENRDTARQFEKNTGYELLQGNKTVQGRLIGGCMEVIQFIKGTSLFPAPGCFDGAILFLETCEVMPPVWLFEDNLRSYGTQGILNRISGIVMGKPQSGRFYGEYKPVIRKVLAECGREDMPVLYNASFGHNEPRCCLPYGALAQIDCGRKMFSVLEPGVA